MNGFAKSVRVAKMVGLATMSLLVGACADRGLVAPRAERATGPRAGITLGIGEVVVTTIVVSPVANTNAIIAGEHRLKIPAGAVCDPLLSSYGPGEWNKPCQPISAPLVITARSTRTANGRPVVDFSPALRFAETDKGVVTLYMLDRAASLDSSFVMYYCTRRGGCVDEALTDPELVTHRDAANGFAYRQIKHFSGYVLGPSKMAVDADAISLF